MRSRTSVPRDSLKFFFLAVITVVAGGLSSTQFSLSPSIPVTPLEALSSGGSAMRIEPDGAVFVSGALPDWATSP